MCPDPDSGAFHIICADSAAVRVAIIMGLGDNVVSLEEVLEDAGIKMPGLRGHYSKPLLVSWKTRHRLNGKR
jgi:hypothetical protein